jgi:hypothetical protein
MQHKEQAEGALPLEDGEVKLFWYCLLKDGNTEEYVKAKAYALSKGIQSQCINIEKHKRAKNLNPIQANCTKQNINKHGSLVWYAKIQRERLPSLGGKKILMLGVDASHQPVERSMGRDIKPPSTKALVACAIDAETSQVRTWSDNYTTEGHMQEPGAKDFMDLAKFAVTACDRIHGSAYMPDVVIVYRDGVTLNHKDKVNEYELVPLENALKDRARGLGQAAPQLVFSLVNKDGRGRFFNLDRSTGDAHNAPPGTAVNTSAEGAAEKIFQLIPNNETLSTAKPVTYIIMANKDLNKEDGGVSGSASDEASSVDSPTQDPPPESPKLVATRAIADILRQKATFVGNAVSNGANPSLQDLADLLTEFTKLCGPHVQGGNLDPDVIDGMVQGLGGIGWLAENNTRDLAKDPPNLQALHSFLQQGLQICEQRVASLSVGAGGGGGGARGEIPIPELQNFSYAMCFCKSSHSPRWHRPGRPQQHAIAHTLPCPSCPPAPAELLDARTGTQLSSDTPPR